MKSQYKRSGLVVTILILLLSGLSICQGQSFVWKVSYDFAQDRIGVRKIACVDSITFLIDAGYRWKPCVGKSTDRGQTWNYFMADTVIDSSRIYPRNIYSLASPSKGIYFAGLDDGYLFRSADDGRTWTKTVVAMTPVRIMKISMGMPMHGVFVGELGGQ